MGGVFELLMQRNGQKRKKIQEKMTDCFSSQLFKKFDMDFFVSKARRFHFASPSAPLSLVCLAIEPGGEATLLAGPA
jgi:hypothetical protein